MSKKYIVIIVTLLAAFAIIAYMFRTNTTTTEEPLISPQTESKQLLIAAFGDSLTAGYGVNLDESYPMQLEKKLIDSSVMATVLNMGVSGETSRGGVERISFVLEQNPDIILLGLGANDMLRSLPPSELKANLSTIIEAFQKNNKKVILLGMQSSITNGIAYKREFDAIYPDLAKKYNIPLVPFFLKDVVLVSELNTSDGIHPNKAGYEKIVNNNILPVLLPYIQKNFK